MVMLEDLASHFRLRTQVSMEWVCSTTSGAVPPFTPGVPLLHSLLWLPVKCRVDYKICLLTYMTLLEKNPVYLYSMLTV